MTGAEGTRNEGVGSLVPRTISAFKMVGACHFESGDGPSAGTRLRGPVKFGNLEDSTALVLGFDCVIFFNG